MTASLSSIRKHVFFVCVYWVVFIAVASSSVQPKILIVGATGTTGLRALQGFLDVGYQPSQLRVLTRNSNSEKCQALKSAGFDMVQADLENLDSLVGKGITLGCTGCYVHSTSSDKAVLDTGEVERARHLADLVDAEKDHQIGHIVYNSAAAHENHGVKRITQKHDVEQTFHDLVKRHNAMTTTQRKLTFTSLRCNIFMEELWKVYTRPSILARRYPLPVPGRRKVYLISVRDLGRVAGTLLKCDDAAAESIAESHFNTINLAGDYVSANDIAKAFGVAQGSPCKHYNNRWLTWKARLYFPELWEQIRFLQTFTEKTDVDALRHSFPGLISSFTDFLDETKWGDRSLSFEDFADVKKLEL